MKCQAAVVGGGPAGLMAAEMLGQAGVQTCLFEAKPSVGRKFLMAGKSGLNLTKEEPVSNLVAHVRGAAIHPMLAAFDAQAVQDWARGLGQDLFTGSTGRVFPKVMKASPLLRAWLGRLEALGVARYTGWRWTGFDGAALVFDTPDGVQQVTADVVVLALGGASWARLGSDGAWADLLPSVPFAPSNAALSVAWSKPMHKVFGAPVKGIAWRAGQTISRGEAVLTRTGLEGGGLYSLTPALRDGAELVVDLKPDVPLDKIATRIAKPRGKSSLSNHLRKTLRLDPVKMALLHEMGRPLPETAVGLAQLIKALPVRHAGLRPLDEAISTVGGVPLQALDKNLMLRDRPGVFCAGEMLDWDAPTGGYLLTACLATGRWAGRAACEWTLGKP